MLPLQDILVEDSHELLSYREVSQQPEILYWQKQLYEGGSHHLQIYRY